MPRSSRAFCRYLLRHSTHPAIRVLVKRTGHNLLPDPSATEEPERDREAELRLVEIGA